MKFIILGIVLGIICLIIKNAAGKKKTGVVQPAAPVKPAPAPAPVPHAKPAVKKMGVYPTSADGQPLQYAYTFEFEPTEGVDVERDILAGEEKIVQVGYDDETYDVLLVHEGTVFGRIHNAQQMNMVRDYLNRKNPVGAILLADGKTVNIRYYRDRRIGNEWREQTVVKLQNCKSRKRQDLILGIAPGDELDIEEAEDGSGKLQVTHHGLAIGTLSAKLMQRYLDDGGYLIAVDQILRETDDNGETWEIPELRIFW